MAHLPVVGACLCLGNRLAPQRMHRGRLPQWRRQEWQTQAGPVGRLHLGHTTPSHTPMSGDATKGCGSGTNNKPESDAEAAMSACRVMVVLRRVCIDSRCTLFSPWFAFFCCVTHRHHVQPSKRHSSVANHNLWLRCILRHHSLPFVQTLTVWLLYLSLCRTSWRTMGAWSIGLCWLARASRLLCLAW